MDSDDENAQTDKATYSEIKGLRALNAALQSDISILRDKNAVLEWRLTSKVSDPDGEPASLPLSTGSSKIMVPLQEGDLVWFRQQDESQRGTVLGDCSSRSVGVQPDDPSNEEFVPPLRFGDGVFRLCSRLNYRSKIEVSKIIKAAQHSDHPEQTRRDLNLKFEEKRMASEAKQNAEQLERLVRRGPNDPPRESIRYGDVVQLQHVKSGLFLAAHKTPAPQDVHCRKVSLKAGSLAAHLKILPKYKVRSIGSIVHADDQIVLQSVKYEFLFVGTSPAATDEADKLTSGGNGRSSDGDDDVERKGRVMKLASPAPELHLQVPAVLRHEASAEVNGSMEVRSFTVKLHHRCSEQGGNLMTGQHWFRLFHTEANAFLQASANPDKGRVLDAMGGAHDEPLEVTRFGGVPAHIPYLKSDALTQSFADASNPIHLSAKAVWCFEGLDRTTCEEVKWRSMPLRIRHVPSGKYLSVDSNRAANVASSSSTPSISGDFGGEVATSPKRNEKIFVSIGSPSSSSRYFEAALVDDADPNQKEGNFGSPSSLIFYLTPTDVTGTTLRHSSSSTRIEHRVDYAGRKRVLHLVSMPEPKVAMTVFTGGREVTHSESGNNNAGASKKGNEVITGPEKQRGERMLFTSEFSALHVLKIQPCGAEEASKLIKLLSYVPLFKKYSYCYHASAAPSARGPPLHLCETIAGQCLDLLDDLKKGPSSTSKHRRTTNTNMSAVLKEVGMLKPGVFEHRFSEESDPRMQKAAYEIGLLTAVFDAVQAPYNYAKQALSGGWPFQKDPSNDKPWSLQKYLNVVIQRILFGNLMAQNYFSSRSSRTWSRPPSGGKGPLLSDLVSLSVNDLEADEAPVDRGVPSVRREYDSLDAFILGARTWETWQNIVMLQGAMVTLGMLLKSSSYNVSKIVNNNFMERFKNLLRLSGPEVRVINLFASICYVEERPSRANQEMLLNTLFVDPADRFSLTVGLQEVDGVPANLLPKLGPVAQPDGKPSRWPRERVPDTAPHSYLGKGPNNEYKQVCVAWTGADDWKGKCGHLWFSPSSLLCRAVKSTHELGMEHPVQFVPIEQLMWVIEPVRLCEAVTGRPWSIFDMFAPKEVKTAKRFSRALIKKVVRTSKFGLVGFENQLVLANYVIAQLELMTQMCRGRSYNCIAWFEKHFSYDLLMNMATNSHLPYKLTSTTMDLIQVLYVDRFPQTKNSGAPSLPEKLWVYNDFSTGPRLATTPVIQNVNLKDEGAFPAFFLSPACSVFEHDDPVLSHPDHFKFYMLRNHCNGIIRSFGEAGRIVHDSKGLNELGMAAIRGQQNLLKFGFQSTYAKLVDLCEPNGLLLDGRSDLYRPGEVFDPPEARYLNTSSSSSVVMKLKCELLHTFRSIGDLRMNFQLGQLLNKFKDKSDSWTVEESSIRASRMPVVGWVGVDNRISGKEFLLQTVPKAVDAILADFESIFPGGSGDGAKLDYGALASKPDLDQALIDCMMYEDDDLFSASLRLLESTYGQRRRVIAALGKVTLLDHPLIPIFGSVYVLRTELAELLNLERTASVWGVQSLLSGSFGDSEFGIIMHFIDKVLLFMHTPHTHYDTVAGSRGDDSSFSGYFSETDAAGKFYESNNLWSLDVADKWDPVLQETPLPIDKRNQDILRACNLQAVIAESAVLDTEIAWKGSICTEREKIESERRLCMVKRAMLVCCTVFVIDNRQNQEIMCERMKDILGLATPSKLMLATSDSEGNDELRPHHLYRAPSGLLSLNEKRSTFALTAQKLILEILRGNKPLCESSDLLDMVRRFTHIADSESDVSTAFALELHFILCKPQTAPIRGLQTMVCSNLTASDRGEGLERVHQSFAGCLGACGAKSAPIAVVGSNGVEQLGHIAEEEDETPFSGLHNPVHENRVESLVMDVSSGSEETRSPPVESSAINYPIPRTRINSTPLQVLEYPERLVRLACAVCEGNEAAAAQLRQSCGISIDAVCHAIVGHIESSRARAVGEGNLGAFAPPPPPSPNGAFAPRGEGESSEPELSPRAILLLMSTPESVGRSLLELLVELVLILPLSHEQVMSVKMWGFMQQCAVPLINALAHSPDLSASEGKCCIDVVDLIEKVFVSAIRLKAENASTKQTIHIIAEDIAILLDNGHKSPTFKAFIEEAHKHKGGEVLAKEACIDLMCKLLQVPKETDGQTEEVGPRVDTVTAEMSQEEREDLERAFPPHAETLTVYEFVQIYSKITLSRNEKTGSDHPNRPCVLQKGRHLSLRTVECGERIQMISQGDGHRLVAQRFTRQGAQWREARDATAKEATDSARKLFGRSVSSQEGPATQRRTSLTARRSSRFQRRKLRAQRVSIEKKFMHFKIAIKNNPRILAALRRRRFSMVVVLENGAPGPPEEYGRSLSRLQASNVASKGRRSSSFSEYGEVASNAAAKPQLHLPLWQSPSKKVFPDVHKGNRRIRLQKHASSFLKHEADKAEHNTMSGAVALSWEDVSKRFVRYVTDHFRAPGFESDTCRLIFETWNAHLIKARTWAFDEDGFKLPIAEIHKAASMKLCVPYDLTVFECASFFWKQTELNRMGVTELLATVISNLSHDLSYGGLPETAIELFNELLNGGNGQVQDALYSHLLSVDVEGLFKAHLASRLSVALEGIRLSASKGSEDGDDAADCEHAICTVRFLQLLCAGHHTAFQNYLRSQNMYTSDVDLVKSACNVLVFVCESTFVVSRFTYVKLDLVAQLLHCLIDSMLGPCPGNQETIILKSDAVAALNAIFNATCLRDMQLTKQNPKHMELRGLSCMLLAASLESREDHTTHEQLARQLETQTLSKYKAELENGIWAILSKAKSEQRVPQPDEVARTDVMRHFLVAVTTVLTELEERTSVSIGNSEAVPQRALLERRRSMMAAAPEIKWKEREVLVGTIEIAWRGTTERTCFPLPAEIKYLDEATKSAFLEEVDLSTSERRMKKLVKKTELFLREMELIYHEAEQFKVYRVLHKHLSTVKLANYGLVVALNLNLLLSPSSLNRTPAFAIYQDIDASNPLNFNERLSIILTTLLGLLSTFGYAVICANLAVTELPLLIEEFDATIREHHAAQATLVNEHEVSEERQGGINRRDRISSETLTTSSVSVRSDGRDLPLLADEGGLQVKRGVRAWLPLAFGVCLSLLFISLHSFNLDVNYGLYVAVVLLTGIPLACKGFRDHIGSSPANLRERAYGITYDCIARRSFCRNFIVLAVCCFMGLFVNVEYFSMELLDVILISPVITDFFRSLTSPARALWLVFYLFCCTVLIYAQFGITHFHDALQSPTFDHKTLEEGREKCRSTLTCFALIFYHGLNRGGNLMNDIVFADPGNNYIQRIIFDSVFFVWVGVVLLNLITGLMINTFMSNREEKQRRAEILKNECFVCGTLRNTYENYALSNAAPSFDAHLEEDHNIWTYVYYIAYLKKKDPADDSGIESFVRSQLTYHYLEWIPTRTCFVLEAEGKSGRLSRIDVAASPQSNIDRNVDSNTSFVESGGQHLPAVPEDNGNFSVDTGQRRQRRAGYRRVSGWEGAGLGATSP